MKKRKLWKRLLTGLLLVFAGMNIIAAFHAYKFTHFSSNGNNKTKVPEKLSAFDKIKALLSGVNNPRPANKKLPSQPFETIRLQSNKRIECWLIKTENAKGTIILFHGYGGEKSSMLDKSDELLQLGYNTLLVDFMGSGSSEGNQTTLGFKEAEEVKTAYEFLMARGERNIVLFGTSMGAVAILKAMHDYQLAVNGIMIECPFGTMYQTVCARFKIMHVPVFPMAGLLVFWGGVENGFNAFAHNPAEYAKNIKVPVLLLYGEQDKNVSCAEIDAIFKNLKGKKTLKTYPLAGHENYLLKYKAQWGSDVRSFLNDAAQ
jgi:uncharacterized protein